MNAKELELLYTYRTPTDRETYIVISIFHANCKGFIPARSHTKQVT